MLPLNTTQGYGPTPPNRMESFRSSGGRAHQLRQSGMKMVDSDENRTRNSWVQTKCIPNYTTDPQISLSKSLTSFLGAGLRTFTPRSIIAQTRPHSHADDCVSCAFCVFRYTWKWRACGESHSRTLVWQTSRFLLLYMPKLDTVESRQTTLTGWLSEQDLFPRSGRNRFRPY